MNNEFTSQEREELLEKLRNAEAEANQCKAEAAIYLDHLKESIKLGYVHPIPNKIEVEQKGALFLHSWRCGSSWLEDTLKALKEILINAENFKAEENSANASIKQVIVKIANEAIITRI
ncbi:MAG: hypothetical protein M3T96_04380 [Acidobacteriota bacterium]|nr:hypothetical protein [Acidobacteriota bacterium]